MIEKIISNLKDYRDIVLSAQELVNERFNYNANSLSGQTTTPITDQKLKNFINKVNASSFLTSEEKKSIGEKSEDVYKTARAITLALVKTEIKNPLTK